MNIRGAQHLSSFEYDRLAAWDAERNAWLERVGAKQRACLGCGMPLHSVSKTGYCARVFCSRISARILYQEKKALRARLVLVKPEIPVAPCVACTHDPCKAARAAWNKHQGKVHNAWNGVARGVCVSCGGPLKRAGAKVCKTPECVNAYKRAKRKARKIDAKAKGPGEPEP